MADSTQTIGSAVETSLLFRLSSLSMLRTIDRFRQSCFDRAATSTSRPAAPFTPARARGSLTPSWDVTCTTDQYKLAPCADS